MDLVHSVLHHRYRQSINPGFTRLAPLHEVDRTPIQQQERQEDQGHRQQRNILVEGHIAGSGAEGQNNDQLEAGELFDSASATEFEEEEDGCKCGQDPKGDLQKKGHRQIAQQHPLKVERYHSFSSLAATAVVNPHRIGRFQ
ncbi:hypothetical protein D3C79_812440 [compost metagenome]